MEGTEEERGVKGYWGDRSGSWSLVGTEQEMGVHGYLGDRSGRRHLIGTEVERGEYRGIGETVFAEGIWKLQGERELQLY